MPGTDTHSKASEIKPDSCGPSTATRALVVCSGAVCVRPGWGTHKSAPPLLPSLVPWKVSWRAPTQPPINNKLIMAMALKHINISCLLPFNSPEYSLETHYSRQTDACCHTGDTRKCLVYCLPKSNGLGKNTSGWPPLPHLTER